ncbi:MAG: SLC13/DASS family transporter [Verrucomicrobiae bacterium]|nr:SLC13/DASS family transporter [Verrucomicrobiae bacterium]
MEGIFLRNRRWLALILGLMMAAAAWISLWSSLADGSTVTDPGAACWTGAVLTLCAVWWVFEPIPIPATSLIPMAIFPLVGVLDEGAIAASYGHHLVILFLSGFMLSRAMERSGAHRRLALGMVKVIGGTGGKRLVLGFMVASAGLSMWISNTATGLMLLPVAIAVIDQCENRRLATPLLLGVAYAASIGGIATPIGTPANAVFLAQADLLVRDGIIAETPGFFSWMKLGLPVVCIMLPLAWLWLTRGKWPATRLRMTGSGAWLTSEIRVVIVFSLTALLWITRQDPFGGWSQLLGVPGVRDSTVGLMAVIALFVIPSGDSKGDRLLDWESAGSIPWGILILFGGGIAIGNAFTSSGLSQALAESMHNLSGLPTIVMIATVALLVTFLTEVTSNTATATVLMPLLAATAIAANIRPELLMVPAAMSASCAFMLPVATPPNAVVYAVGEFSIKRMAQEGLVLNFIGAIVITTVCYLLLR